MSLKTHLTYSTLQNYIELTLESFFAAKNKFKFTGRRHV